MRERTPFLVLLFSCAVAATAAGQVSQYTAPGALAVKDVSTKERFEAAMEDARYRLGPFRIAPWLSLRDFTYVDNVFGTTEPTTSDFTATVGAGLHAYLPMGEKLVLGAYVLPEYVWWADLESRRGLNGRVGVGLFGYFNRLTVEAKAFKSRTQQYASNEFEVPVNLGDTGGDLDIDLRILERLSLYVSANEDRWRYREEDFAGGPGTALLLLDRDETRVGGGLRYRFREDIAVSLGYTRFDTDFFDPEFDASNSGSSPTLSASLDGKRLWASATVYWMTLDPKSGSVFVPVDGTAGRLQLGWRSPGGLDVRAYGGRSLAYSVSSVSPYYVDDRWGLSVGTTLGWRTQVSVFGERGNNRYVGDSPGTEDRRDDVTSYGTRIAVTLGRKFSLDLYVNNTDYDSPEPGTDRSIMRVQTSLRYAGGRGGWW